jgi:hypothetical protein
LLQADACFLSRGTPAAGTVVDGCRWRRLRLFRRPPVPRGGPELEPRFRPARASRVSPRRHRVRRRATASPTDHGHTMAGRTARAAATVVATRTCCLAPSRFPSSEALSRRHSSPFATIACATSSGSTPGHPLGGWRSRRQVHETILRERPKAASRNERSSHRKQGKRARPHNLQWMGPRPRLPSCPK